jgi:energy-coupling factor transporter ATP-binding protein EcfA2
MSHLGTHEVRLVGRAGSGKSTTLALLARRAVQRDGGRVLFLTYQRVLRGELDHLVRAISGGAGIPADSIVVMTLFEFLLAAFTELGGRVPTTASGEIDYRSLRAALQAFVQERGVAALARDAEALRELYPELFTFDYVFVDEAQDWGDPQRDLLRALFPPERTVIADGLEQFAQRQSRCDWTSGVPRPMRYVRELNRSLRMSANVARFVTAFAGAMGYVDWRIQPHHELVSGRVILAGGRTERAELVARVLAIARDAGVSPGDCLIASPPRVSGDSRTPAHETIREELAAMGYAAWDATDEQTRVLTRQPDEVPLVPYGSLRGLEGWAAVLVGLDRAYENKLRHPNLDPDEATTPNDVARNAMLLAATRAAHVLAITIDDEHTPVAKWIEEAARACGEGVVERF